MSTPVEIVLATARSAFQQQRKRIADALRADLKKMALAAMGTETGRSLLAAAPPEAQEILLNMMAEEEKKP